LETETLIENNKVLISIVIVNYRGWFSLIECLDSIQVLTLTELSIEVIVIDNFSDDGQFDIFKNKYLRFNFVENSGNNGFANGCNLGAKLSKGTYLLFLNPDTKINDGVLEVLLRTYKEASDIGILSCLQIDEKGRLSKQERLFPIFSRFFGVFRSIDRILNKQFYLDRFSESENELFYPDWVSGSVVFMHRDWFDKVSGWNEDYWLYFEDVDLSKRVSELGAKIAVTKQTTIFHKHGGASRINVKTKALTKTEVIISKHVYISENFNTFQAFMLHFLMISGFLLERVVLSLLALVLFLNKKLRVHIYILKNLIVYYINALIRSTWISPRSVNYLKK
jgi:GT2 family glycosyltransferase